MGYRLSTLDEGRDCSCQSRLFYYETAYSRYNSCYSQTLSFHLPLGPSIPSFPFSPSAPVVTRFVNCWFQFGADMSSSLPGVAIILLAQTVSSLMPYNLTEPYRKRKPLFKLNTKGKPLPSWSLASSTMSLAILRSGYVTANIFFKKEWVYLAWESSRHFATPPQILPQNDF